MQDFLEICKELGISVGSTLWQQHILSLTEAEEVTVEEAQEAHEAIQVRKTAGQELEKENALSEEREQEILTSERAERAGILDVCRTSVESVNIKMKNLLQPFRVGKDTALFLVNF